MMKIRNNQSIFVEGQSFKMGRRIFDNLPKAYGYTFAIHVAIAGLLLIPIIIGDFPLILPVQIVFLELIINPACSIIFEAEKSREKCNESGTKTIYETFFGMEKILLSCFQGLGILFITLAVYYLGLHLGYSANEVSAMAFVTLIVSNIAIILTNRSLIDNIFWIISTRNTAVLWVVGVAIFFLALILNIQFFIDFFQFQSLTYFNIIICSFVGLTSIIWLEIYKPLKPKTII